MKVRVVTYLDPRTVEQIDDQTDEGRSEYLRALIHDDLGLEADA